MAFSSIFEQQFDVAIYGTGYAGIAAALRLQKAGIKVLLFDRRFDVAWESGRNFAARAGEYQSELWNGLLQDLRKRHLFDGEIIDSGGAEVALSAQLRQLRCSVQTLLGAWPVEIALQGDVVRELTVATKSGLRTIRAARWIDASDEASLLRLMAPKSTFAAPNRYEYRAILQHKDEKAVRAAKYENLDNSAFLERRLWAGEFTLGMTVPRRLRVSELMELAEKYRAKLAAPLRDAALVAFADEPLPIYSEAAIKSPDYPNLVAASAAIVLSDKSTFLGNRFQVGEDAAERIQHLPQPKIPSAPLTKRAFPVTEKTCDIFIAGAGTAGALAALAVNRADDAIKVLCSDVAPFAGGVGSGGLINGYFHGQTGGLFEEFDEHAQQVGAALDVHKPKRGHETKKIAFEQEFLGRKSAVFLSETLPFEVNVENRRINAVKLATPNGIIHVKTKAAIDATGDGDFAILAGANSYMGRKEDGFTLSYSQPSLVSAKGNIRCANFDAGWANPADAEDWTRARLTAIAQYQSCQFSDDFHIILLAPILGIRQSRHVETEETLTLADLLNHSTSAASIGKVRSPLDTHSVDYEFEDDETLFWLWGCKSFRESTFADMPYGITVAKNYQNLWIAARSAGIAPAAAYAARMQRDMQRIGEAVGYAAVIAVQQNVPAQDVDITQLQEKLRETGALEKVLLEEESALSAAEILAQFDQGIAAPYLWQIYQNRELFEVDVLQRFRSDDENISWLAAVLLAMWNDSRAESRLIRAIDNLEEGAETPALARGPFSQWIDIPNWLLAINLLRLCGSADCLPALQKIAEQPQNPLNVRTSIALTVARLADKLSDSEKDAAGEIIKVLLRDDVPNTCVRPSRSIWRELRGEPQNPLPQEAKGVDTREDHRWRLDFAVTKAARKLGLESPDFTEQWNADERALVRRAFAEFI